MPAFSCQLRDRECGKLANALYRTRCQAHRARFYAFAALPLPHIEESLAEIARTAGAAPVVGVTIGCSVGSRQLDHPWLRPVFEALDERGSVVFLHPVGQEDLPWLAGHGLAWLLGAPFEATGTALRLILGRGLDRYPHIRFIVPHLAGTLRFLLYRGMRKTRDIVPGW